MAANESETIPASGGSSKKSSNALIPIIVVILLVPALCYGVMEFLIIPKLKSASGGGADHSKTESSAKSKKDSHGGVKPPGEHIVEFGGIVVNLAGSGNSRYLRTNFIIASSDKDITKVIEDSKGSLKDAAITVLSTQSLDALDGANGREVVRKGLITRFNNVLGGEVIDQIYFTEFLIQ